MLEITVKAFSSSNNIGDSLGFGIHADETIKALKRLGVNIVDEAKIVLHIGPAHLAKAVPEKKNVLYTAWEAPHLPSEYIEAAKKMDLIIGVSKFVAKVFGKAVQIPVDVCHLGVDVNKFTYVKRKYFWNSGKPFVYLWVGAPNERKGWQIVRKAWQSFSHRKDCLLIMKTTKENGKLEDSGNVIIDSRKIPIEDLVALYHFANCFIFPSYAEGFGLTLAEAMATGLPCIFTPCGGVSDFAMNETGYPLSYDVVGVDYGVESVGAAARVDDLVDKMINVKNNYKKAVWDKGKKAADLISKRFTWDDTGRKMKTILENFRRDFC